MKPCLHRKYGSLILFTITNESFSWCRNCGALFNPSTGAETLPQTQVEKLSTKKKKGSPDWEMTEDPF